MDSSFRCVCKGILFGLMAFGLSGFVSAGDETREPKAKGPTTVLVELDGTGSTDPNGDTLQYEWKQIGGPTVKLSDATAAKPFFRTAKPGLYTFQLVVADQKARSKPSVVEILVERANLPPEARIPTALEAEPGDSVRIDGSRSRDADGDKLAYFWRQRSGRRSTSRTVRRRNRRWSLPPPRKASTRSSSSSPTRKPAASPSFAG